MTLIGVLASGGLAPGAPTIGTATAGDASATVTFTAPSWVGKGSGTVTYTATSSPGSITGTTTSGTSINVTGLTNGQAYTFTVTATTSYGVTGPSSAASNSVTPAVQDAGSMFPLGIYTVPSGGVSSVTFSSIPSTYTHLQIRASYLNSLNLYSVKIQFNGDSGSNYWEHQSTGTGASVSTGAGSGTSALIAVGAVNSSLYTGAMISEILDYKNTNKYKVVRTISGADGNGSGQVKLVSSLWLNTNAINSITINNDGSNFNEYSSFALYGMLS